MMIVLQGEREKVTFAHGWHGTVCCRLLSMQSEGSCFRKRRCIHMLGSQRPASLELVARHPVRLYAARHLQRGLDRRRLRPAWLPRKRRKRAAAEAVVPCRSPRPAGMVVCRLYRRCLALGCYPGLMQQPHRLQQVRLGASLHCPAL